MPATRRTPGSGSPATNRSTARPGGTRRGPCSPSRCRRCRNRYRPAPTGAAGVAALYPSGSIVAAAAAMAHLTWATLPAHAWPLAAREVPLPRRDPSAWGLPSVSRSGAWLNAAYSKSIPELHMDIAGGNLARHLTAVILSLIVDLRRPQHCKTDAPSCQLRQKALGRGRSIRSRCPESGPDDIRQTARSLQSHAGAPGALRPGSNTHAGGNQPHDIRTPLTSLRLRAEFVTDPDVQEKMPKTIGEIRTMTEAALAFCARERPHGRATTHRRSIGPGGKPRATTWPSSVTTSTFIEGTAINYRCRPDALRRAIRNLIENAVRYGERARVSVARTANNIDIVVEDDGPGIPDEVMEQVFAPFIAWRICAIARPAASG